MEIRDAHRQLVGDVPHRTDPRGLNFGMTDIAHAQAPSLLRRLGSILYDLVLVAAVVIIAAFGYTVAVQSLTGAELTQGAAQLLFRIYLLAVILGYYLYFWTQGRQSLAMRTWRLLLLNADGSPLRLADAIRRVGFAILTLAPIGLGLWWMLFDPDRQSWYDRLAGTRLVLVRDASKGGITPEETH